MVRTIIINLLDLKFRNEEVYYYGLYRTINFQLIYYYGFLIKLGCLPGPRQGFCVGELMLRPRRHRKPLENPARGSACSGLAGRPRNFQHFPYPRFEGFEAYLLALARAGAFALCSSPAL